MKRIAKLPTMFGLWAAFFAVFWIVSVIAGGDAVNGKIEDGRYYLCSHGKYTQVSRADYVTSASAVMIIAAGPALLFFILLLMSLSTIKEGFWAGLAVAAILLLFGGASLWLAIISLGCILRALAVI